MKLQWRALYKSLSWVMWALWVTLIFISLALSQTPASTVRPRRHASTSHAVSVYSPAVAGLIVPIRGGMARLSLPGWLVLHWDGLATEDGVVQLCWLRPSLFTAKPPTISESTLMNIHIVSWRELWYTSWSVCILWIFRSSRRCLLRRQESFVHWTLGRQSWPQRTPSSHAGTRTRLSLRTFSCHTLCSLGT